MLLSSLWHLFDRLFLNCFTDLLSVAFLDSIPMIISFRYHHFHRFIIFKVSLSPPPSTSFSSICLCCLHDIYSMVSYFPRIPRSFDCLEKIPIWSKDTLLEMPSERRQPHRSQLYTALRDRERSLLDGIPQNI